MNLNMKRRREEKVGMKTEKRDTERIRKKGNMKERTERKRRKEIGQDKMKKEEKRKRLSVMSSLYNVLVLGVNG
jgi:hypothetical protein